MRTLPILLLVCSLSASANTIYQCRDLKGRVTLQDSPCPGAAAERAVRSGQDEARERYLAASGDPHQSYARGLLYGMTCRVAHDAYAAARRAADAAAARGDLRQMNEANAAVSRAGKNIADQGC